MEQVQDFSLKHREYIVRVLTQAKERVQADLETDREIDDRIERELLPKLVKEGGATGTVAKARRLWSDLQEAVSALRKLGAFFDDDGELAAYPVPETVKKMVEAAKQSARRERDQILKQYDLAILGIWAVPNIQEAKKVTEGLL